MSQDLSRWMGAVSDVDAAHKSAKNPTMFRKVFSGGTIEQEAIEAFTAKKRLEEQRYELQQFIKFTHGTAWDELLRMEGQIRKRRQKEIYDRKIFREKSYWYRGICGRSFYWFGSSWSFRLLSLGGGQRMVGIELETNASVKKAVRKHLNGFARMDMSYI